MPDSDSARIEAGPVVAHEPLARLGTELDAAAAGATGPRLVVPPIMVVDRLPDTDPQKAVIRAFIDAYSARHGAPPPPASRPTR